MCMHTLLPPQDTPSPAYVSRDLDLDGMVETTLRLRARPNKPYVGGKWFLSI